MVEKVFRSGDAVLVYRQNPSAVMAAEIVLIYPHSREGGIMGRAKRQVVLRFPHGNDLKEVLEVFESLCRAILRRNGKAAANEKADFKEDRSGYGGASTLA